MRIPACAATLLLFAAPAAATGAQRVSPMHGGFETTLCHMAAHTVRQVDFNAYYRDEADARRAARELDPVRFSTRVRRAVDGPDWLLDIRYRGLPTQQQFDEDSERIVPRLRAVGGRYAGSGCGSHPFRPSRAMLARMRGALSALPVDAVAQE